MQNSDVLPIVESTWATMESMVIRSNPGFEQFRFEPIDFPLLKTQMNAWRKKAGKLDGPEKSSIAKNLLRYFRQQVLEDRMTKANAEHKFRIANAGADRAAAQLDLENFVPRIPSEIEKYAVCCFAFTPDSVIAEDQFSHLTYNQGGSQSRNSDVSVFNIITVKECDAIDAEPKSPMPTDLNWDELKAVKHDLTWRG